MNEYIKAYITFLKNKKKSSQNTIEAYVRDLSAFEAYLISRGISDITSVEQEDVIGFLMDMKKDELSTATMNRRLASTRSFFKYMVDNNHVIVNPVSNLKAPKVVRGEIEYLTIEEIEELLSLPDDSPKGIRDRAIFEVLYGTGILVSELVELTMKDVNMRMGFITCNGQHGKARIVPLGDFAKEALKDYLKNSRPVFVKDKEENDDSIFFVNFMGHGFTRQGLWKIITSYGEKSSINKKLTLQIIRHSFAVHMIENGADLKTLQELLGHEDISATQIYLKFRKNKIKEVYDRTHPRAVSHNEN